MSEKKTPPPAQINQVDEVFAGLKRVTLPKLVDTIPPSLMGKTVAELTVLVGNASLIQDAQFLASKRIVHGQLFEDVATSAVSMAMTANVESLLVKAATIGSTRKTNAKTSGPEEII